MRSLTLNSAAPDKVPLHAADWLAMAPVAEEGSSIALRTVTAASAFQKTGGIDQETSASSSGGPAAQQAAEQWRSLALQLALLLALTAAATESHQVSCRLALHVSKGGKHPATVAGLVQFSRTCISATERWADAVMGSTDEITLVPSSLEPARLSEPEDRVPASLQQAPTGTQAVSRSLVRCLICCSPA